MVDFKKLGFVFGVFFFFASFGFAGNGPGLLEELKRVRSIYATDPKLFESTLDRQLILLRSLREDIDPPLAEWLLGLLKDDGLSRSTKQSLSPRVRLLLYETATQGSREQREFIRALLVTELRAAKAQKVLLNENFSAEVASLAALICGPHDAELTADLKTILLTENTKAAEAIYSQIFQLKVARGPEYKIDPRLDSIFEQIKMRTVLENMIYESLSGERGLPHRRIFAEEIRMALYSSDPKTQSVVLDIVEHIIDAKWIGILDAEIIEALRAMKIDGAPQAIQLRKAVLLRQVDVGLPISLADFKEETYEYFLLRLETAFNLSTGGIILVQALADGDSRLVVKVVGILERIALNFPEVFKEKYLETFNTVVSILKDQGYPSFVRRLETVALVAGVEVESNSCEKKLLN